MRVSTKRILSMVVALVLLVGALMVYGSLIRPALDGIGVIRGEIAAKQDLLNNQEVAVSQARDLLGELQNSRRIEETVSLAIPIGENTTQAMSQIQAIVQNSNVTVQSLSLSPKPFLSNVRQSLVRRLGVLQFNLSVNGGYDNIKNFLESLETNVRVANLETLKLSRFSSPAFFNLYGLNVVFDMYYQE